MSNLTSRIITSRATHHGTRHVSAGHFDSPQLHPQVVLVNKGLARQNAGNAVSEVFAFFLQIVADSDAIRHVREGLADEVEAIQMIGPFEIQQRFGVVHEGVNSAVSENKNNYLHAI